MDAKKKKAFMLKKVNETVEEMKWMILTGQMPVDKIHSFSDLHDYCDANMLGNSDELWEVFPEPKYSCEEVTNLHNEIQNTVDRYIKSTYFEMFRQRLLNSMKEAKNEEAKENSNTH